MAQADELQLGLAAHARLQVDAPLVRVGFRQQALQRLLVLQLPEEAAIVHLQGQPIPLGHQAQLAVAGPVVLDLLQQVLGHRVLGPGVEGRHHFRAGHTRCRRVPEAQGCDPVGVDVLGAFHQLREAGQLVPHHLERRVRHFQEQRAIALDDQGIVGAEGDHVRADPNL